MIVSCSSVGRMKLAIVDGVHPRQGMVVHDESHNRQAIILEDADSTSTFRVTALVWNQASGQRDLDALSTIEVAPYSHLSHWHVAERFDTFGLTIPMPPPSILTKPCAYRGKTLKGGETCDCGCGRTKAAECECDYCDDCDQEPDPGDALCETCMDHGTCSCDCGCGETSWSSGDRCGYCEGNYLCENCAANHDVNSENLCDSCANSCRECGDYRPGELNDDYECPTCSPPCEDCLDANVPLNDENVCSTCAEARASEASV